ncbi:sensor histidine kinase [Nocardioides flavescens]|uniref:sensor histidine kinase n=1 Tax=Nocardioides flavescens TaxID=2691959 RepID=UPI00192677FE|nr:sensor histidine kinase [Nocardioides flavescens]
MRSRTRPRLTLASQFLLLQVAVLCAVVAVTGVVSFRQTQSDFSDTRGARLRAAAESLASTQAVQDGLEQPDVRTALSFYAQQRADTVGATAVYLTDADGVVFASTDPTSYDSRVDLGPRTVLQGRTWTGDITIGGDRAIAAAVPVFSNNEVDGDATTPPAGTLVGAAVVAEDYPPLAEQLRDALDDIAVFLSLGLMLGVIGSWLLARLIKRRTRGLEPAEIAALADQREALLTSIREGVVAVDAAGRLTVVSDAARELLGLPDDAAGRRLDELGLPERVGTLLAGADEVHDAVLVVAGRAVVVNRSRVEHEGRPAGTVTTLRDRTELLALQSELQVRRSVTDTLRAQTHEFSNQLHTISGLVQLEEYAEVGRLIGTLTRRRAEISDAVGSRVEDAAVAALLIAKTSVAAERRVRLTLSDDSAVPRLDPELSADLTTVVGNLVDNAVDAASGHGAPGDEPHVEVRLAVRPDDALEGTREGAVVLEVADTGPGVPPDLEARIFGRGFSTKPSDETGRGFGLALVQVVCERRGGRVSVGARPGGGAVFTAVLPCTVPHEAHDQPGTPS